jgi:hypothetical protein
MIAPEIQSSTPSEFLTGNIYQTPQLDSIMSIDSGPKPYGRLETNIRISPFHSPIKNNSKHTQGEAKNADLIFLAPFLLVSAQSFGTA